MQHRIGLFAALFCAAYVSVQTAHAASSEPPKRPNIVFILADDMGYGDVQALNPQSKIPTPNLNRLARSGMTFTDAHTPSAVCTPTRYGLVTGRYCWRSRLKSGVLFGESPPLIERDRPTVASFLTSQGYQCGIVGKWHLGLGFARTSDGTIDFTKPIDYGPEKLGFAFSHIVPASADMFPYVYVSNGVVVQVPTLEQPAQPFPRYVRKGPRAENFVLEECLDHLLAEAQAFLKRAAAEPEKPFFLYFPMTAPHKPVWPHRRFVGSTDLGPYGDFVHQVDWTVGQVLNTLDELGIAENTLVIYTSDNGSFMFRRDDPNERDHVDDPSIQAYRADHHTANYIFRGTKADIWEGGHHVPFFVRWPGVVEPGSQCADTICLTDFFATAAELLGANVPEGAAPDSYSFLPQLLGQRPESPRPPVIHHSVNGTFAIRKGEWKLVLSNGSGGREAPKGKPFERPYQLFNLKTDPSEKHNVIEEHPEIAKALEQEFQTIYEQEGR
ncbi:MAG: Cerebroside-sulfatase [Planctomycetota bacterium]|nr:MAG: Cerebroside-sulfatase [Planctomycetota bacterium]